MKNGLDLGKGPLIRTILNLAWPMMLGFFFHTLFNIIDAMYLGRYSPEAIAAVSLTFPVIFFIIALASGAGIGITSLIARNLGAKRKKEAENVAEHGLLIGLVLSILFTTVGLAIAKPLFRYIGASDALMPLVIEYVSIIFAGSIFMFGGFIVNSILRGEGDMKTPMKIMIIATLINIILDPIFIFGWLSVPEMGVAGAAWATLISRAIATIYAIVYILRGKSYLSLDLKKFKFRIRIIADIFKVGIPASLSQTTVSLGFFFLTKFVATYGDYAVGAFGIVARLDSVAMLPIVGIGTATITMVGFNVGAKNYERAEKVAWASSFLAFLIGSAVGIVYFIFPEFFMRVFSDHPDIVSIGAGYLAVIALFTGYSAVQMIIGSSFQGTGKAYPSFILVFLRMIMIMLPVAYYFSIVKGWGIEWIWWSLPISGTITSTVALIWFKMGTWKKGRHKVITIS